MSKSKTKVGSVELQANANYCEGSEITETTELCVLFAVLKINTLLIYMQKQDVKDTNDSKVQISLPGCAVKPLAPLVRLDRRQFGVGVETKDGTTHNLFVDTPEEQQLWLSSLLRAAVPYPWPAGAGSYYRGTPAQRVYIEQLPPLREQPPFRRKELMLRKLQLCAVCFHFNPSEPEQFATEKQRKRETLLELVDLCDRNTGHCIYNDFRTYSDVLKMISLNLFRALPSRRSGSCSRGDESGNEPGEEEGYQDPAWPHLAIVYELLLRLVQATKIEIVIKKKATSVKFLRKLLRLFDTDDNREREYLKTSTHRIYGKLTNRRAAIRRSVNNIFFEFLYESRQHSGISELLEILASIINGFAVPIKAEHKMMLIHALIPLHKMSGVNEYHPPLSYCMVLFCGKDRSLTTVIIRGLLRFWPYGNSAKELCFLQELDELFEFVTTVEFSEFRKKFMMRLLLCIKCPHVQVSERALWFWNNETFKALAVSDEEHRVVVLKMIFDTLSKCAEEHWHEGVKGLASHVLMLYKSEDLQLYEEMVEEYAAKGAGNVEQHTRNWIGKENRRDAVGVGAGSTTVVMKDVSSEESRVKTDAMLQDKIVPPSGHEKENGDGNGEKEDKDTRNVCLENNATATTPELLMPPAIPAPTVS